MKSILNRIVLALKIIFDLIVIMIIFFIVVAGAGLAWSIVVYVFMLGSALLEKII